MRTPLLAWACLLLAGCWIDDPATPGAGGAGGADAGAVVGLGTDDATTAQCLGCHGAIATPWANASSHRLLLDCNGCHHVGTTFPHAPPAAMPVCSACHSEAAHPDDAATCVGCHDPHGSANAFLIRETITRPDGTSVSVHLTQPEGASPEGLVHTGAAAGTGICETCHTATAHYDSQGKAAPHETTWCGACHDHQRGFSAP